MNDRRKDLLLYIGVIIVVSLVWLHIRSLNATDKERGVTTLFQIFFGVGMLVALIRKIIAYRSELKENKSGK